MNKYQVREYVTYQLKNYRVRDLLDAMEHSEIATLYKQIVKTKPWETERRLIDYAVMELDKFRYNLYCERHYEDLLIDKACLECLRCEDLTNHERKYYVRRPNRKGEKNEQDK